MNDSVLDKGDTLNLGHTITAQFGRKLSEPARSRVMAAYAKFMTDRMPELQKELRRAYDEGQLIVQISLLENREGKQVQI